MERSVYNVIAADGLTIGDFTPDMWGTATKFSEVLQPSREDDNVAILNIVAAGTLDDSGTPFSFRVTTQVFDRAVFEERVFRLKFD